MAILGGCFSYSSLLDANDLVVVGVRADGTNELVAHRRRDSGVHRVLGGPAA